MLREKATPDVLGETFTVLKEDKGRLYGEYRTRRLVLAAWEKRMDEGRPRWETRGKRRKDNGA
jgi:hypothetical protein